jgi:hypothetical protein
MRAFSPFMSGVWATLLALLTACGGEQTSGSTGTDSLDVNLADEVQRQVRSFPSPVQLAALLKQAGAQYNGGLLHPENRVSSYQTTTPQALNLGVYSADMAYANIFEQRQVASRYLAAVRSLSSKLGLDGVFGRNLEDRVRANEQNQDSLVAIFSETLAEIKTRLHENQQPQILNFMFVGGFVEGLHLAIGTYKARPNEQLLKSIGEQKFNIEQLMEYVEPLKTEAGFAEVHAQLVKLKAVFDQVTITYTAPTGESNTQGEVVRVQNQNNVQITPEVVQQLEATLAPLRKQIVG